MSHNMDDEYDDTNETSYSHSQQSISSGRERESKRKAQLPASLDGFSVYGMGKDDSSKKTKSIMDEDTKKTLAAVFQSAKRAHAAKREHIVLMFDKGLVYNVFAYDPKWEENEKNLYGDRKDREPYWTIRPHPDSLQTYSTDMLTRGDKVFADKYQGTGKGLESVLNSRNKPGRFVGYFALSLPDLSQAIAFATSMIGINYITMERIPNLPPLFEAKKQTAAPNTPSKRSGNSSAIPCDPGEEFMRRYVNGADELPSALLIDPAGTDPGGYCTPLQQMQPGGGSIGFLGGVSVSNPSIATLLHPSMPGVKTPNAARLSSDGLVADHLSTSGASANISSAPLTTSSALASTPSNASSAPINSSTTLVNALSLLKSTTMLAPRRKPKGSNVSPMVEPFVRVYPYDFKDPVGFLRNPAPGGSRKHADLKDPPEDDVDPSFVEIDSTGPWFFNNSDPFMMTKVHDGYKVYVHDHRSQQLKTHFIHNARSGKCTPEMYMWFLFIMCLGGLKGLNRLAAALVRKRIELGVIHMDPNLDGKKKLQVLEMIKLLGGSAIFDAILMNVRQLVGEHPAELGGIPYPVNIKTKTHESIRNHTTQMKKRMTNYLKSLKENMPALELNAKTDGPPVLTGDEQMKRCEGPESQSNMAKEPEATESNIAGADGVQTEAVVFKSSESDSEEDKENVRA